MSETPTKADLVAAADDPNLVIEYHAPVAGEWRVSNSRAEAFEKWGPGPTTYRIVRKSNV